MEPIVLVGGGEVHYRLIQLLKEEHVKERPIILVAQNIKVLSRNFVPYLLKMGLDAKEGQLDLWTACQRKGVYFLEDLCLKISREEKTVTLKKFGRLKYQRLSFESPSHPTCLGYELEDSPFHMLVSRPYDFMGKMREFFDEVHKHCPREVRVVFTGFNNFSIQMALTIQEKLVGGAEATDVLILEEEEEEGAGFFKSRKQKEIQKLKKTGVRVIQGAIIQNSQAHLLKLSDGTSISYDVLVPASHERAEDFLGKILQFDSQKIMVTRDLREVRGGDVFVTGGNVQFEKQHLWVSEIDPQELAQTLLHNVFVAKEESPCLQTRDKKILETQGWSKGWESKVKKLMASLREVDVLEPSRKTVLESLTFQADHMSRPWQGLMSSRESQESGKFRLNSVNGFNSWGSFALSAIKVTEMALLKSLARGVAPKQLRFNLTLPAEKDHLLNHIFESTFRGIESVAEKQGVEIDGGDTFDGKHWHLNVTVGGEALLEPETKFNPHDYLLMTRPLGFGFLWAGRLSEPFDSQWIQRASQESLVPQVEQFLKFLEKWRPSGRVLIEEWGFLFHCLQKLPAHQQLMVNFREVPRWGGTDFLIDKKVDHPGIDVNWQRICSEVAFRREDVSKSNSVMWDSMSQGSLVFGLSAEKWQEALHDLKEIGYKQAALVGCIRPKTKGNRVVLSDWSP